MKRNQNNEGISHNPANALLVTCSESALHTAFATLLDPACIYQNFGGTLPAGWSDSGWGTVDYAIQQLGIRRIVLCGHSHCRAPMMQPAISQIDSAAVASATPVNSLDRLTFDEVGVRSQLWLVKQMRRLSSFLDSSAHRADIFSYALWFDEDRGPIFTWPSTTERFAPADDAELLRLLSLLGLSRERAEDVLTRFEEFSHLSISG